jgi:hypothetical protein
MTTTDLVYGGIVDLVEALTPNDVTQGNSVYRFVNQQADDVTSDRGFTVERIGQRPSGDASTTSSRYLTQFVVTVFHAPSRSLEADEKRVAQDVEQLIVALRNVANHYTTSVGAILQDSVDASTSRDDVGNYETVISFVVNHI